MSEFVATALLSACSRVGRARQGLMSKLRRLQRDVRGIAAVEFALLVPILLLMLLGTVEVTRAVSIDRRFGQVTAMVADLVARETSLKAADINAIYAIVNQVMSPFTASTLKISIIPVKASPVDATKTLVYAGTTNRPSYNGGSLYAKCAAYKLTSGLVATGSTVIVIETSYTFTPLFSGYLLQPKTWTDKAIVSPRNSCVDFDGDNCVSTCF